MTCVLLLLLFSVLSFFVLAYVGHGYSAWVCATFLALSAWNSAGVDSPLLFGTLVTVAIVVGTLSGFQTLRRGLLAKPLMRVFAKNMPKIGETEEIALQAGTVWWEKEFFKGTPDWHRLLEFQVQPLTRAEKNFLAGPVEELCAQLDDWQIIQQRDLSPKTWTFLKKKQFFGMIIPEAYGGLGFSAAAHSAVITKIASRSVTAAVTVMVPNSLGPAELLLHYGTEEQKNRYLPRLADGREVPCFALTEPHAGSDAANGRSVGIVCEGDWEGETVVGIRLTFDKRYITLAPVATLVGLTFHLYDPDQLIGDQADVGITCALVPHDLKGMEIGDYHDPMGVPFTNGPVRGKDLFIPVDFIIGGRDYAGKGWRMLMENLSAGRGISLPALSVGAAETACRATSAYGVVREQFGLGVGRFEGVQAPLARIAGYAYLMNATRILSCAAVDHGERPSVVSAIAKAYLTEGMRVTMNEGMDVLAGSAISRGPANIFATPYQAVPIGITVEGANILTRSLIIFGQGALRCHPFMQDEVKAVEEGDLTRFDHLFFSHLNHVCVTAVRAFGLAMAGGILSCSPVRSYEAKYYHCLNRFSLAFSLLTDLGLFTLGGAIKRKEHLSGRYADALAWLYICSAVLKQFKQNGCQRDDRPALDWAMAQGLHEIEKGLMGILRNLPTRPVAAIARLFTFPLGSHYPGPSDQQVTALVTALLQPGSELRERLTGDIFIPDEQSPGLGTLEAARNKVVAAEPARSKVQRAMKLGQIKKGTLVEMAAYACQAQVISEQEETLIVAAETLRDQVVQVSSFTPEAFFKQR